MVSTAPLFYSASHALTLSSTSPANPGMSRSATAGSTKIILTVDADVPEFERMSWMIPVVKAKTSTDRSGFLRLFKTSGKRSENRQD